LSKWKLLHRTKHGYKEYYCELNNETSINETLIDQIIFIISTNILQDLYS